MNQALQSEAIMAAPPLANQESVDFLERMRPGGPHSLTAIKPDGPTVTVNAFNPTEINAFIAAHNGDKNIYFQLNRSFKVMNKKAAKIDIVAIEFLHADLDPKENETRDDAKARYREAIESSGLPKPTWLNDSGNGIQAGWRLALPIRVPDPVLGLGKDNKPCLVLAPEAEELIANVEKRSEAIMLALGSHAGTQNVDRILRLPGTINHPNAKKLKAGREKCYAKAIEFNNSVHAIESFPLPERETKVGPARTSSTPTPRPAVTGGTVNLKRLRVSNRVVATILTGKDPEGQWSGRSECVYACCLALVDRI